MSEKKGKFITIGQIDMTGVIGPHEKELRAILKKKLNTLKNPVIL